MEDCGFIVALSKGWPVWNAQCNKNKTVKVKTNFDSDQTSGLYFHPLLLGFLLQKGGKLLIKGEWAYLTVLTASAFRIKYAHSPFMSNFPPF